ncbi:MAG: formylglycine-generating enzyme family protein [Bacteroidia bacterium]|nr:formylglycine-generating enzyme family protein [Bacteroidia bacterium]
MDNFWTWLADQLRNADLNWLADNITWLGTTGIGAFLVLAGNWGIKQGKALWTIWKEKREKKQSLTQLKDLHPYFSEAEVERARKYYVETQGQNVPPSRDQEPGRPNAFTNRSPLIPQFLNEAFANKDEDHRFYLVLADSGMGKTTFMINLYLRYLEHTQGKAHQIRLYPLGYPDVQQEVRKLVEEGKDRDTILLLDAFDEDGEAARDYRKRMDEWVLLFKNFREVVMTSRTQFFPDEAATTGLLSIPRSDPARPGFHQFKVMYLSPFSDADIKTYLNKKFPGRGLAAREQRELASRIVAQSPYLMVRPMLLAHIDDLMAGSGRTYQRTCDIYQVLIDKWLDREAMRKRENPDLFRMELIRFSEDFAAAVYQVWIREERLHLSPAELTAFAAAYQIKLDEVDMTSRSLLNRDALGNVKFSHKSVLEFFLARRAQADLVFFRDFRFQGMDVARKFMREYGLLPEIIHIGADCTIDMISIKGGSFAMGSQEREDEKPPHRVELSRFYLGKYPVTQRQWEAVMGNNPSEFKGEDLPVENVSWGDCQEFIRKLNTKTGMQFRLPTEAEWEYAAGGGAAQRTKWAGTDDAQSLGEYAWYDANSGGQTHPVGQKRPNQLGLYDMSGNVWEWCQDWYDDKYYASSPADNPQGPAGGASRVVRGGSWLGDPASSRVSFRYLWRPDLRSRVLGFRLARSI